MYATQYGVDPYFCLAVANIESGNKTQEFRTGRLGKSRYAGPFGLHIAYVREKFGVDATDPMVNIEIGVRALRGRDKIKVLRRYYGGRNRAYERAVLARYRELAKHKKAPTSPTRSGLKWVTVIY